MGFPITRKGVSIRATARRSIGYRAAQKAKGLTGRGRTVHLLLLSYFYHPEPVAKPHDLAAEVVNRGH